MGVESINEPDSSRTWMVKPVSINEPPDLPGPVVAPTITLLTPNTALVGDPSFTLYVTGTDFVDGLSTIVFAGNDEPTTLEGDGTLSTLINMAVWLGADTVKVEVRNFDQVSNSLNFVFGTAG